MPARFAAGSPKDEDVDMSWLNQTRPSFRGAHRFRLSICPVVLLAAAPAAFAADFGYSVQAGVGETDNVRRTPQNHESETVGTVGLQLGWLERRARLDGNLDLDLSYLDYLHNTYDSELVGNVLGDLRVGFVPDRFTWSFRENFGQSAVTPLSPVTPENRENVNRFSTGPDFFIPFDNVNRLGLSARYSKFSYEKNPFDNDRYSGQVELEHKLSTASSVSFDVRGQRVEFDDTTVNQDYKRNEAFVRYTGRGGRTSLLLEAGATQIELPADRTTGSMVRVQLSRQVSAYSTLSLIGGHEFADAGSSFLQRQERGGAALDTQSSAQSSNPFKSDYASLSWNFLRNRTGLDLSLDSSREIYQDVNTQDRERWQATAGLSRRVTPQLEASLLLAYAHENYLHILGDAREADGSILVTWQAGRMLMLSARYDYFDRSGEVPSTEFTENRFWLRIGYGRMPERRVRAPDQIPDALADF
jgi:hypothetical protein